MNEEGNIPSIFESRRSPHSHAKKRRVSDQTVSLRVGSSIGTANSKDQPADSADEVTALKVALLKSEAEKKSLLAKLEYEGRMKSADVEILKIAHEKVAIEWRYRLTRMESEMKAKAITIEILESKLEESVATSKHNSDSLNKKLEESRAEIDRYKNDLEIATSQMNRVEIPLESEMRPKETRKRKSDGEICLFANEATSQNKSKSMVIVPERKHCAIPSLKVMYDELTEMLVESFPDGIYVGEISAHYERKRQVEVDPIAVFALSWNELIAKKFNSRIRMDNGKAILTPTYIKAKNLQVKSNVQRKGQGIVSHVQPRKEYVGAGIKEEKMDKGIESAASTHPTVTFIPREGLRVDASGSYNTFSLTVDSDNEDKYVMQVNCGSSYYRLLGSTSFATPKQPKLMQVIREDGPRGRTPVRVDFVKVTEGETRSAGDIIKRTAPTFSVEYTFNAE